MKHVLIRMIIINFNKSDSLSVISVNDDFTTRCERIDTYLETSLVSTVSDLTR